MSGKRKPSFVDHDVNDVDDDDSFEASDLVGSLSASVAAEAAKSERTFSTSSISETDLDYESVSSPGNSSTASGPTYVRPAGFDHHAHQESISRISVSAEKCLDKFLHIYLDNFSPSDFGEISTPNKTT
jgi:hypothetical protein